MWTLLDSVKQPSRSSHEERGLKYKYIENPTVENRRSSHEERGLKSYVI